MTEQQQTRSLSDLISAGQVQAPPEQMDQTAKEQLAEDGTPFTVNSIQYGDDEEFGPYWQFAVDVNGKQCTFRLAGNANRDGFLQGMASATAQGPISGVRLRALPTRRGQKFLTVEPA